jgi:MFS family permease
MSRPAAQGVAGKGTDGSPRSSLLTPLLFTLFWIAQTISLFGDRLNNFSLIALINRFADDPSLYLSATWLAMYLPVFILAPLIGVVIDRLDKRWILVLTDLCRGLLVMLIPVLFSRTGSFLPVLSVVFFVATGNLFFLPAKSGLLPELIPPEKLLRVNSILWATGIFGVIGGFLGGGFIFDYLSWSACFYIDGITYLVSSGILLIIALRIKSYASRPAPRSSPADRSHFYESVREGFAQIRRCRELWKPLGVQAVIFFGAGGFSVLAIVFIKVNSPEGSSMGLAAAGLAAGLGMAIGSLLVGRLWPTRRTGLEILFSLLLAPAAVTVAFAGSITVVCIGLFTAGLAATPLIVISESSLQRLVPSHVRGRVFSLREIMTRSLFLISSFLFSILGKAAGMNLMLTLLGFFLAGVSAIWIMYSGRWHLGADTTQEQ